MGQKDFASASLSCIDSDTTACRSALMMLRVASRISSSLWAKVLGESPANAAAIRSPQERVGRSLVFMFGLEIAGSMGEDY